MLLIVVFQNYFLRTRVLDLFAVLLFVSRPMSNLGPSQNMSYTELPAQRTHTNQTQHITFFAHLTVSVIFSMTWHITHHATVQTAHSASLRCRRCTKLENDTAMCCATAILQ